ncbi:hypothetical protein [Thermocoleostomius sinensis]|uniref:DUF2157 domain-containing protein n=1 Tax=Thermocoleostomius sinensis A174 TaxID=2016057 RepID=A0A9E8ZF06_9CYAN|nr:hypothetical protein [Thermocoleostomius sinensis]WAL60629.1 hypothetical protein OXH18_01130 [Thermocoleostomius sinensis A174]
MVDQPDRAMIIRLSLEQLEQAELLQGLESWLQLGLLNDRQVRQLCQQYLICALPSPLPVSSPDTKFPKPNSTPIATSALDDRDVAAPPATRSGVPSARFSRSLQALMSEISVIWLLFLGVFLVVVSSGVLAASQWQLVSPIGQYSILLTYTLVFFGVGRWAAQRSNLRLTARMLHIATLLIIPVNFWMIDGLQLWRSPTGILVGTIAILGLSGIMRWLWQSRLNVLPSPQPRLVALHSVGLSWLHLGWVVSGVPLIATYLGTIGTACLLVWSETMPTHIATSPDTANRSRSIAPILLTLLTLLLIGRAVFAAQVPWQQLGLAVGLCGWVMGWLSRSPVSAETQLWTRLGSLLLLAGWAVSVTTTPPRQALAVSGLALWLLIDRLQRTGRSSGLLLLFIVGLQAYSLIWWLFPASVQQAVIATAGQVVGNAALPQVLLAIAGFPYLWLTLALASWLHRQTRSIATTIAEPITESPDSPNFRRLAQQAETIAFMLGLALVILSLLNPGVRSITLWLATGTLLGRVYKRASISTAQIYLVHLAGLTALISSIDWQLPMLSQLQWGQILLGLMAVKWGLSVGDRHSRWRRSAWFFGLGLAGLSYVALLPTTTNQALIWLIAPALLTGLSRLRSAIGSRLSAWFSTIGLCAQLLLIYSLNGAILSFALATGLMALNTATLRQLVPAVLTIGMALGLEFTLVWKEFAPQITQDTILLLLAAALWQLWLLHDRLRRSTHDLQRLYAVALNGWAIGLSGLSLLLLTGLAAVTLTTRSASGLQLIGVGTILGAISYRLRQQPTDLEFWGLAWGLETATAIGIGLAGGDTIALGAANVGLGLVSQWAGDGWVMRSRQNYRVSWHLIPLLYAGLGLLWVHRDYTAFTGLYTLLAAGVGLGVARRSRRFHLLTLLSLILVSVATYKLLVYRLWQSEGEYPGDGWTLLAGLAMLIAWSYHGLASWLRSGWDLGDLQRRFLAHAHWGLGSGLAGVAVWFRLSPVGTGLLIVTALALSGYALTMGHDRWRPTQPEVELAAEAEAPRRLSTRGEAWIYAGLLELLATITYGLYEAIPDTSMLLSWAGTIAAVIGIGFYQVPWRRWGWSARPGQQLAIGLPIAVVGVTAGRVALQSLLIVAAFYAWLAKALGKIRVSYLSVLLFEWALLRFLWQQNRLNGLWIAAGVGGALLYVAQIDPALQPQSARDQRHWLRSIATGLISLTAFYQAEVETGAMAIGIGVFTLGFGIALILSGLLLRIRAFLYLGTVTFIGQILRWLWQFINTDAVLLWSVGILLGVAFIWIAATFEARRSQMNAFVQYWSSELETWE